MKMADILVIVDGGVVQDVYWRGKAPVTYAVWDRDNLGTIAQDDLVSFEEIMSGLECFGWIEETTQEFRDEYDELKKSIQ